jgi:NAD(P)-dependent dehydrogenase (short-subunit alcohol dehydrogenase family)
MELIDRTAIITGASRGIGKQIAVELGRRGANVVVAARTVEPHRRLAGTIGETVEAVEAAGGQAIAVRTDLREPAQIRELVEGAVARFGGIDVLVNNAADTSGGSPSILELDRDDWLQQFAANLHGPFSLMQAVLPSMRDRGRGVVVNMTSGAAELRPLHPAPGVNGSVRLGDRIAYAASKAALNRLGNVIAPEVRDFGVAVVMVDPGFTRTELVDLMSERGVVDAEAAVPMEVPVKTVLHVITCADPMQFSGQILRAATFVKENAL